MSTTDFESWMGWNVDSNEYEQVLSLYEAISERSPSIGVPIWDITIKDFQVFVKSGEGETLMLLTEKAVEAFLSRVDERYGQGMGVEAWAASQRAADNTP